MMRQQATLTYGALRVLAALLLVDGRRLTARELALIASPWVGNPASVRDWWMPALRAAGCQIVTMGTHGEGYRLLEIPPDALLDDVLAVARQLQREHPTRLWEVFGRAAIPATVGSQIRARRLSA